MTSVLSDNAAFDVTVGGLVVRCALRWDREGHADQLARAVNGASVGAASDHTDVVPTGGEGEG